MDRQKARHGDAVAEFLNSDEAEACRTKFGKSFWESGIAVKPVYGPEDVGEAAQRDQQAGRVPSRAAFIR
jgi:hypothetical protein